MLKKAAEVFVITILIIINASLITYNFLILFDQAKAISAVQHFTGPYTKKIKIALGTDIEAQAQTELEKASLIKKNPYPIAGLPYIKEKPRITPEMNSAAKRWEGPAPISVGKCIEIDLSAQRLLIWENGILLGNFLASTGKEKTPTEQGVFKVLSKAPVAYGSGDGQQWKMPYWIGIYRAGGVENGIHALPYVNGWKEGQWDLGHPVSHGCVRVSDANAIILYNWAEIGIPVIIHQ